MKIVYDKSTGAIIMAGTGVPEDDNQGLMDFPDGFEIKDLHLHEVKSGKVKKKTGQKLTKAKERKADGRRFDDLLGELFIKMLDGEEITEDEKLRLKKKYNRMKGIKDGE